MDCIVLLYYPKGVLRFKRICLTLTLTISLLFVFIMGCEDSSESLKIGFPYAIYQNDIVVLTDEEWLVFEEKSICNHSGR